jgi:hypothetical protein
MLVRLLYASRAAAAVDADMLTAILKKSRANNAASGVTGLLCFSAGIFLQVLEGGRLPVNKLYHRIAGDPRHTDVALLSYTEITERSFAGWSMGQVNLARLNPALLLKYSETATLDPYAMSGPGAMALLDELAATASVVGCT